MGVSVFKCHGIFFTGNVFLHECLAAYDVSLLIDLEKLPSAENEKGTNLFILTLFKAMIYRKLKGAHCSEPVKYRMLENRFVWKRLRFSCHLNAYLGCQEPLSPARTQAFGLSLVMISIMAMKTSTASHFLNNTIFPFFPEELIQRFALFKRNCFASVFEKYFDYQQAGSGGETHAVINYRDDESM